MITAALLAGQIYFLCKNIYNSLQHFLVTSLHKAQLYSRLASVISSSALQSLKVIFIEVSFRGAAGRDAAMFVGRGAIAHRRLSAEIE